jgi:hypothetical protein
MIKYKANEDLLVGRCTHTHKFSLMWFTCEIHLYSLKFERKHFRVYIDRLCGLVVRVLGYRSGGPGSIPGTTRKKQ